MNILGIWDGHDSGAALLQDGQLRFAVNEERLSRRKLGDRVSRAVDRRLPRARRAAARTQIQVVAAIDVRSGKDAGPAVAGQQGALLRRPQAQGASGSAGRR